MITPNDVGAEVVLTNDDYYSRGVKGTRGTLEYVCLWYWRADIRLRDGEKINAHLDNLKKVESREEALKRKIAEMQVELERISK